MKTKIFGFVAALALTVGLSSCHDDTKVGPVTTQTGSVNLKSLGIDVSNAEKVIETSRASIDLSDYVIQIYNADGAIQKQWTYNAMPEVFELPVGSYTARVYSHEVQKAEWDRPYFLGEKEFEIANDNITDLGIVTCTLGNIKVTVRYTDRLRKYMGDDVVVTVVANDQGRLEFTADETRSGYFEAIEGSSTIILEFNGTVNGYRENHRLAITDAEAGQHRIVTYDIKAPTPPSPTNPEGGIDPGAGVGIDASVTDEDLRVNVPNDEDILDPSDRPGGEEPGGEEPGPGGDDPKPENTITIEAQAPLSFEKDNNAADFTDGVNAIVNISAPKGVTHFLVKIESSNTNFIASAGELLPLSFDLAYPTTDEDNEKFSNLGFPTRDKVIGATELKFDITAFVPLLTAFPGKHTFTLTVQDNDNMQTIKVLTIVANE